MLPYLNNPNVAIINILSDDPEYPRNCEDWGSRGNEKLPIIINDYNNHDFGDSFECNGEGCNPNSGVITWSSPWYLIIDQNFIYKVKTQDEEEAKNLLEEMLTNME